MSAHWHIGMEVECINDIFDPEAHAPFPVLGARYFICEIRQFCNGITLQFTTLKSEESPQYWPGFAAERFRPVQKRTTDISIFTALLNPSDTEKLRELEAEILAR